MRVRQSREPVMYSKRRNANFGHFLQIGMYLLTSSKKVKTVTAVSVSSSAFYARVTTCLHAGVISML